MAVVMRRWLGRFPSLKLNRMVGYQSLIERDFIYLLDFDVAVTIYCEQPLCLHYKEGSKQRRYTPDFSFSRHGQTYLVECKHHQFLREEDNRLKWAAAQRWCEAHGEVFVVVTEAMIRAGHRLENVKLLTDYARYSVDEPTQMTLLQTVMTATTPLTVAELMTAVSPTQPQMAVTPILHLAYYHQLFIPLDEAPISVASPVMLGHAAPGQTILPAGLTEPKESHHHVPI
jgi:hypothetical protein